VFVYLRIFQQHGIHAHWSKYPYSAREIPSFAETNQAACHRTQVLGVWWTKVYRHLFFPWAFWLRWTCDVQPRVAGYVNKMENSK
jgi:hypothetical protein